MTEPKTTVRTFTCTALTEEHICAIAVGYDRGMHHQRIHRGCAEGVEKHHRIAYREFQQSSGTDGRYIQNAFREVSGRLEYAVRS